MPNEETSRFNRGCFLQIMGLEQGFVEGESRIQMLGWLQAGRLSIRTIASPTIVQTRVLTTLNSHRGRS